MLTQQTGNSSRRQAGNLHLLQAFANVATTSISREKSTGETGSPDSKGKTLEGASSSPERGRGWQSPDDPWGGCTLRGAGVKLCALHFEPHHAVPQQFTCPHLTSSHQMT